MLSVDDAVIVNAFVTINPILPTVNSESETRVQFMRIIEICQWVIEVIDIKETCCTWVMEFEWVSWLYGSQTEWVSIDQQGLYQPKIHGNVVLIGKV